MSVDRFLTYVTGGQPPGGNTTHPGCRDRTPPAATTATWLPGQVYFAQHSTTWGGAVAFYDHDQPGPAPAVAYLITAGQLADIVHQEMHRPPGTDLDLTDALTDALTTGRSTLGPGRYETLLTVGQHHGRPQVTFTAPWAMADVDPAPPSGPYLRTLLLGLCATHHWTLPHAAAHLADLPGVAGHWSVHQIVELCQQRPRERDSRPTPQGTGRLEMS